ncbi:MAG: hypothetical protein Q9160_005076 [Pyrenula sp. 1 TL-2023]
MAAGTVRITFIKCTPTGTVLTNYAVIIAVDDSVKTVKIGGPEVDVKTRRPIRSKTYEGGYRNFVDNSSDQEPPLSSTFDDLCFFLQHHSQVLDIGDDPLTSTTFLQKIIASNYMMLIKYVKSTLNHLSFRLSQRTNLNELDSTWVESGWSDLQVWTWRCNKYCQRVEAIMNSLGIEEQSRRDLNKLSGTMSITTTCGKDFQGIHRQLMGLRERSEMLVSDFNSVAAIILNREALREANRSIQEAKSVRVLTLLGMVFLPLGLASSLLSMSDDYSPGEKNFWIYFAIAIPLVLFVILVAGAIEPLPTSPRSKKVQDIYSIRLNEWLQLLAPYIRFAILHGAMDTPNVLPHVWQSESIGRVYLAVKEVHLFPSHSRAFQSTRIPYNRNPAITATPVAANTAIANVVWPPPTAAAAPFASTVTAVPEPDDAVEVLDPPSLLPAAAPTAVLLPSALAVNVPAVVLVTVLP